MNVNQSTPTVQTQYAGLGIRFLALVIDLILMSMIFFPVTRLVKGVWIMSGSDHLWGYGWLITDPLCLIFLLAIFLYFVLLEAALGVTIGKKLTGIRVVATDGRPPGLMRAFIRNLLRFIDGLPAFNILGVVLILSSPERARFGDRIAKTRVILRR